MFGKQNPPGSSNCLYSPLISLEEHNNNDDGNDEHTDEVGEQQQCQQNYSGRISCCCCCCLSRKRILISILISLSILVVLIVVAAFVVVQNYDLIQQKFLQKNSDSSCPLIGTPWFRYALEQQRRHGLRRVQSADGRLDTNATWTLIPQHFNKIWAKQFNKLNVLKLQSDDEENKYFIVFSSNNTKQPPARQCTFITLGVGHTVNAERKLTQLFPECRLITADPSEEINENLTHAIGGTFVQAAIGGETGTKQPVNFWGEDVQITKNVERKILPQIGIMDFLRMHFDAEGQQQQQHNIVDLLLIDIEGAEFGILEQLADNYDKFPAIICQMNIEVHDPNYLLANYTHQQFFRTFDRIIRWGPFALMHTDMYTGAAPLHLFLRMFLVNVGHEQCTRKFLC